MCIAGVLYNSMRTVCKISTIKVHFESNYSSEVIDARARLHPNGYSCNFSWLASKQID